MKTGTQYAAEVRTLRAAGFDFPAGRGYTLANSAQWSSGKKAAVTRAINFNKRSISAVKGAVTRRKNVEFKRRSVAAKKGAKTRRERAAPAAPPREEFAAPDIAPSAEGLSDAEIEEFWDDAAGDENEEWDDIMYFDFDEMEDLIDEESDDYPELA